MGYNSKVNEMKRKKTILKELKNLLTLRFGDDIENVILFGSRAKGMAYKNSDYDVLIVLNRDYDWQYQGEIISVIYTLELEYDIFIDTKIISTHELQHTIRGKHPLYVDAVQEGIYA